LKRSLSKPKQRPFRRGVKNKMIDSPNVEERIKAMVGLSCGICLDSGIVQEYVDGEGWIMVHEIDPVKDGEGKPVRRMKICNHGTVESLGY
jgi:hypothetical protein